MMYFSVFSGIEAASAAWEPLGWTPLLGTLPDEGDEVVISVSEKVSK